MRKCARGFVAAICAALVCLVGLNGLFTVYADSYNDEWVADYENMKSHVTPVYTVPTLFKNDAAFSNNRRFPLVVQNNVEYVPLEMFSGLSGISVTANYSPTNFYITNSENSTFISFDADNDLVTTTGLLTYTLVTKLFYDTRYVPAEDVAKVLGISAEVYNDPDNGVYALRFTDGKQKLTFAEVIKMYSPIKKTDTEKSDSEKPEGSTQNPTVDEQPKNDKDNENVSGNGNTNENGTNGQKQEIGRRSIYLSYDVTQFSYVPAILSALKREGLKCAFFVSPSDILNNSDTVRQIIASGQEIGFLLGAQKPEDDFKQARDNLYLVAKCTTRLVRFSGGSRKCALSNEEYKAFVDSWGLSVWDYNISLNDSSDMYEKLYSDLFSLSSLYGTQTAIVRFYPGRNGTATITKYAALLKKNRQLTPLAINAAEKPIYYRRLS